MTRLLLAWAFWRLIRRFAVIALIATLGVLLLSGGDRATRRGSAFTRVESATRAVVRDMEQTLEKGVER